MSTILVIVLRAASLFAFAAPVLLGLMKHDRARNTRTGQDGSDRLPVFANVAAFALFLCSLLTFSGAVEGAAALLLASVGCLISVSGAAVVLRSRIELGPAWSFVPVADEVTGFVTTGPYRYVRHPIYLGLSLLALGQALAFASCPAVVILIAGIVPTFVWRAAAEEKLLFSTFGERYARYQMHTKMIIPHLL